MNFLQVNDGQQAILINRVGERFYVLYHNEVAFVYQKMGHLGSVTSHKTVPYFDSSEKNACEFLGGRDCELIGSKTAPLFVGDRDIFNYLKEIAGV